MFNDKEKRNIRGNKTHKNEILDDENINDTK